MRHVKNLLAMVLICACSSCATPFVWKHTNPAEFVALENNEETRQLIEENGLAFYEDYGGQFLYVEKTDIRKFQDYSLRTLGVPIAVVVDTAIVILVVAVLVYGSQYYVPSSGYGQSQPAPQQPDVTGCGDELVPLLVPGTGH